jgi:hypothetical protein
MTRLLSSCGLCWPDLIPWLALLALGLGVEWWNLKDVGVW